MIARSLLTVLAAMALALPASADDDRALVLAREARRLLDAGDPAGALAKLEEARVDWSGSDLLHHALADARTALGAISYDELETAVAQKDAESATAAKEDFDASATAALEEYERAFAGPHGFRARFNAGVLESEAAEVDLKTAGVPLSPEELPDPFPGDPAPLIESIDRNLMRLQRARAHMLEALSKQSDPAARESVAALTRRLDDLAEMKERLEQQQEDQEQDDEENEDEENEDEEEENEDEQEEEQDEEQEPQDEQDPKDNEDPQDGEDEEPQDENQNEEPPPQPQQAPPLTAAQVQELLDKLEELEEQALELARARRERERQAVERDW